MNYLEKYQGRKLTIFAFTLMFALGLMLILFRNSGITYASAETLPFMFTTISDTECEVRLIDKSIQQAIIPETTEINGKQYTVTAIATGGFSGAANLEKVRIPKTVKVINPNAFANCKKISSITLPAVEAIGTNAFALTNLDYIILPETVKTVGPTILRNTDTKVFVRAELAEGSSTPEGTWSANWNGYNANQHVEYGSDFVPEIKYKHLSEIQGVSTYSLNEITLEGYIVDNYQEFVTNPGSEYAEVYIPAVYKGEPVVGIANSAFYYNDIDKITIGYSESSINIASFAFNYLNGQSIIINRSVEFEDQNWQTGETEPSEAVFSESSVSTIILPDTIIGFGNYAFMNCQNLKDIRFISPQIKTQAEEESFDNIESTKEVDLPNGLEFLRNEVFSGISTIENLKIPSMSLWK